MRIAIHTLGSRGDVQPYLALALGLRERGHDVLLAAPTPFEAFVGERGIAFAHLPGDFLDLMNSSAGKAAVAGGDTFSSGLLLFQLTGRIVRKQLAAEWEATSRFGPELIIHHPKALGAPNIAEKLDCPSVLASPVPG